MPEMSALPHTSHGHFPAYDNAGNPIYFICGDGGVLCVRCANEAKADGYTDDPTDPQWYLVGYEAWEGTMDELEEPPQCAHCYKCAVPEVD